MRQSGWWRQLGRLVLLVQFALPAVTLWHQVWPRVSDPFHLNPWWKACPAGEHIHVAGTVDPGWKGHGRDGPARDRPKAWHEGREVGACPEATCFVCSLADALRSMLARAVIGTAPLPSLARGPAPIPVLPEGQAVKGTRLPRGPPPRV